MCHRRNKTNAYPNVEIDMGEDPYRQTVRKMESSSSGTILDNPGLYLTKQTPNSQVYMTGGGLKCSQAARGVVDWGRTPLKQPS